MITTHAHNQAGSVGLLFVAIVLALHILLTCSTAHAAEIAVVGEAGTQLDEPIIGWVLENTAEYVTIAIDNRQPIRIPANRVAGIDNTLEDRYCRGLHPSMPDIYFTRGMMLLERTETPHHYMLGRRLLLLAAKLDPATYYTRVYRYLAQVADTHQQRLAWLERLVIVDPTNPDYRQTYTELQSRLAENVVHDYYAIIHAIHILASETPTQAIDPLTSLRTPELKTSAVSVIKLLPDPVDITPADDRPASTADDQDQQTIQQPPLFGTTGPQPCPRCYGYGAVICDTCRGTGLIRHVESAQARDRNTPAQQRQDNRDRNRTNRPIITFDTCTECTGLGSRTCPRCNGSCIRTAAHDPNTTIDVTDPSIRQAAQQLLDQATQLYQQLERQQSSAKIKPLGRYVFNNDTDFTHIVYNNGIWTAPAR